MNLSALEDTNGTYYPFYGQSTLNNGIISYNRLKYNVLNNPSGKPTILIHSNNQNIVYLETPFYLKDGHGATSVLQCEKLNRTNQMFIIAAISKVIKEKFEYNNKATKVELKKTVIKLPTKNKKPDFDFMESFIAELEAERIAELSAYLKVSGLKDYKLTKDEEQAIQNYENISWDFYNLEKLFGKATRGKRLKSADRIEGDLPFVTAGEANEGVSAYINNKVDIFENNTTTIDMFGSAKYRNYRYGADDHVAVVHTEELPMKAAIFVTSAIHKAAHTGKFDYGHNFYAKDADMLNIMLPVQRSKPDYHFMEILISAIQKVIIKDIVQYADRKIATTKSVTGQEAVSEGEIS